VRRKLGLDDELSALQSIAHGKTTTAPDRHSGEGIFFTSKLVDLFILESNGLRWTVDNLRGDQSVGDVEAFPGTTVTWNLQERSSRSIDETFRSFSDPDSQTFDRSRASVKLFRSGQTFVSRSEAKRLASGLESFREVEIDFSDVTEVGQGFVDELFRVWQRDHPETLLIPTNMSRAVRFMVQRGLKAPQEDS